MSTSCDRRRFIEGSALLALTAPFAKLLAQEVPRSPFGPESTALEVTEGIDLSGKVAVVTGCNSGIGLETMRALAYRGAHVIGTARDMQRGQEACDSVEGRATPVVLELTEFDSVAACAETILALDVPVDILVCNAGVLLTDLQQVNGLEMQFVVNHLGHYLLTRRLMDRIIAAPQGRVVVVGSMSHRQVPDGGIQFDNLSGEGWAGQAYGHSKLANGLFSFELARRFAGTSATSNSLHPGVVSTNIFRNASFGPPGGGGRGGAPAGGARGGAGRGGPPPGGGAGRGGGFGMKTPEQGAATSCYVATAPALADVTGQYFVDCNPEEPSAYQTDAPMAARLWEVSEALTRAYLG